MRHVLRIEDKTLFLKQDSDEMCTQINIVHNPTFQPFPYSKGCSSNNRSKIIYQKHV